MFSLQPLPLVLIAALALPLRAQRAPVPPTEKQQIVVTGTAEPVPLGEADREVSVIALPAKAEPLYRTPYDLLQLDPSLDLRQRGPNGIQGDLSIRGATFGQTLVLLDGMRWNDVQTAHANLDLPIPLESIAQVEILKGTGSTLYGSDAIGGVVNILTRHPEALEFHIRGALGNYGTNQEGTVIGGLFRGVSEQISLSRDFSTGFAPDRDYRNLDIASSTGLHSRLGSTGLLLALSDRPFGADHFYGNYNSWERTKGWFAALHQNLGANAEASVAYRRHTDLFVLFRDRPSVYTNRHQDESWQADVRRTDSLPAGAKLHYGIETILDSLVSNNLGTRSRSRASLYAVYDLRVFRRYSLSAGVREELYRRWRGELSPSLSGAAWLSSRYKLRAAVSHAFRLPTYTDLYYSDPANLGNPNLKPEKAWSTEAGLDASFSPRLQLAATVFERRDTSVIDYVRYSPSDRWQATNFDRLHFTGAEAYLRFAVSDSQQVALSYAVLHGSQQAAQYAYSKYLLSYPVHSAVASWQGTIPGGLIGRTRIGVTQLLTSGTYGLWDGAISRGRGRVRPFLQARNLTSTTYIEVPGVKMPKREVLGGLEWFVRTNDE